MLLCGPRGTAEFVGVVTHLPLLSAHQFMLRFGVWWGVERLVVHCHGVAENRRLSLNSAALFVEVEGRACCDEQEHHGDHDDDG